MLILCFPLNIKTIRNEFFFCPLIYDSQIKKVVSAVISLYYSIKWRYRVLVPGSIYNTSSFKQRAIDSQHLSVSRMTFFQFCNLQIPKQSPEEVVPPLDFIQTTKCDTPGGYCYMDSPPFYKLQQSTEYIPIFSEDILIFFTILQSTTISKGYIPSQFPNNNPIFLDYLFSSVLQLTTNQEVYSQIFLDYISLSPSFFNLPPFYNL